MTGSSRYHALACNNKLVHTAEDGHFSSLAGSRAAGDMVLIPDTAMHWLHNKINTLSYSMQEMGISVR